jgi:hypothetical protein
MSSSCERRDPLLPILVAKGDGGRLTQLKHWWLWAPARAEPVIGRRFAATCWLGRDDIKKHDIENNGALRVAPPSCDSSRLN